MYDTDAHGFTVADLAARYRVGPDKIRFWIKCGELTAINTSSALCARPRYIVTADALEKFERSRSVTPPPKQRRRRRSKQEIVDYYPD
jgi:hypothetical protein